jgi:hypothetical protein
MLPSPLSLSYALTIVFIIVVMLAVSFFSPTINLNKNEISCNL